MTSVVPDILARIVERKRQELHSVQAEAGKWERLARERRADRRDFRAALVNDPPAIIAEIKRASPSKGVLSHDFDPVRQAKAYQAGGAAALSVLTDADFFQGSLAYLEAARAATTIPVLRKDFTIDPVQVTEAAAHGADAILLIAAILSAAQMREWRLLAASYGMAALVEVHTEPELDAALASGAEIVGVNNRDLHTFRVDAGLSERLAAKMPAGLVLVSESGVDHPETVQRLQRCGYQSFLVGEHLMRSADAGDSLRALRS